MSANHLIWKHNKIIILIIIILSSVIGFAGIWFLVAFINVSSLKYVDDLKGYSLSKIQGHVEVIDFESYSQEISSLKGDKNPVYGSMFPESVPNNRVSFFCYSETVKPNRNYFDRWEVYACCEWNEKDYINETNRLKDFAGFGNGPTIRNDLFPFTSFVYTYQSGEFLYTLFDESSFSIYYIFLCEIGSIENIVFDRALAPTKPWHS